MFTNKTELNQKFSSLVEERTRLLLVTRKLKEGMRRNTNELDKYDFLVYNVDINEEIRKYIFDVAKNAISSVCIGDIEDEIGEFQPFGDDIQDIFSFSSINDIPSFTNVPTNKVTNTDGIVRDLNAFLAKEDEELWAYCYQLYDEQNQDYVYCFRKKMKSSVAIPESEQQTLPWKKITILTGTDNDSLEIFRKPSMELDDNIDFVFYDDAYYVLNRNYFEMVTGLRNLYIQDTRTVIQDLENADIIQGLDVLNERVVEMPSLIRKMALIKKLGNYEKITKTTLKKMQKVCRNNQIELNVDLDNKKLIITNDNDVKNVVRLLCDYYKLGAVSGKSYGTYSGKLLN